MVYTVGGIKGGSGKTTTAANLAVWLAGRSRDVLLVDADDQESASDFIGLRAGTQLKNDVTVVKLLGKAVFQQVPNLKGKYQDIVIETGGRETDTQRAALVVCSRFLVPFVPRSVDIWTMEKVENLIREVSAINTGLRSYAFLNRADIQGKDNADAADALRESELFTYLDHIVRNRKALANSMGQGLGVGELKPVDEKAVQELNDLFTAVTVLD